MKHEPISVSFQDHVTRHFKTFPAFLSHYTSVETLALILKNKSIRFKRLDLVDDLSESKRLESEVFAKYIYVSCWTDSPRENLALWSFYGKGLSGVCIKMPFMPFQFCTSQDILSVASKEMIGFSKMESRIKDAKSSFANHSLEIVGYRLAKDSNLQTLTSSVGFIFMNDVFFCRKIDYTNKFHEDLINPIVPYINYAGIEVMPPAYSSELIGRQKHIDWKFQKESRYILPIYPKTTFAGEYDGDRLEDFQEFSSEAPEYFDISLTDESIRRMTVIFGPRMSEGSKEIIEALKEKCGIDFKTLRSSWEGKIDRTIQ